MNFLTAAFGVLFMVGFLFGAAQGLREDSAAKVARYQRLSDETAPSGVSTESQARQAAMGIPVPNVQRDKRR